jgi:hypothetical protein
MGLWRGAAPRSWVGLAVVRTAAAAESRWWSASELNFSPKLLQPHPPELHREEIVTPLSSNAVEEMEENVARITQWVADYKKQHGL